PPFSTTTLRAAPTAANPRSAVPAAARGRTGAPARQLDDVRERRVLARRALLLCRGGARAGQRADQAYLRAHRAADPSNPLEDHLLAVAREVQPHRGRAAAPVHVGGAPGDERDSLGRAREREQVGRVDPLIERRPDEQAALRMRPAAAVAEVLLERLQHHVAPAPVQRAELLYIREPSGLAVGFLPLEVLGDEQLRHRRG